MVDTFAFSPDLEAYICYAVVFLAGFIVASVKLQHFFQGKPGAWGLYSSWGLFAAYSLIPVLLFWFLDRTGAVHDTSLFAALLIGFGYQQVLTGSSTVVRGPADLSSWWKPFEQWADWTGNRVLDRLNIHNNRFAEKVIGEIRDPQSTKFTALKTLAFTHVDDPAALSKTYDAIDTAQNKGLMGAEGILEKQVSVLYRAIRDVRDADYLLFRKGVITRRQYYWYAKGGRSIPKVAIGAALILIGLISLGRELETDVSDYYLWRITKTNSTEADRKRAEYKLMRKFSPLPGADLLMLTEALKRGNMLGETADRLLAIIVETRPDSSRQAALRTQLTQALRTGDPDIRARVHSTLLGLARDAGLCLESVALRRWKPSKTDSVFDIDEQIKNWTHEWTLSPASKACPDTQ